ncbi:Glutarate-semialdehyde dehydrogenase DavD [Ensifer adhaerens]|uniref:Acyl-CoA reductase-like NAD-dependent aldehyde dehydrogenase n=1 Tax=Ensifer adhaerens TaxID=106592 RepID=A0ACC5T316_ENSAD|nr:aldehyde dehydrogenase family protein [Ensifer adhaerens]MBP1875512.1 acyl-CoA reductase-like NAD-dependent aldehyde dehydrogenase [Ensifer adhaerens]NRP18384.1 Glutarate-semialdehyde dehydrogenase DavD [Ensifer adhaerens]
MEKGFFPGVQIGPLIDHKAINKVDALVSGAVARGARTLTGGRRRSLGGTFYEPTVMVDVPPQAEIFSEEIFGPVAPTFRFETEEEVTFGT